MLAETKNAVEPVTKPAASALEQRAGSNEVRGPVGVAGAMKFLALLAQLALLAILIKRFNLESPAFFQLTVLAFAGFAVHYFLPLAARLPFFLALSIAGIVMVLGVTQAAWLLGIGIALIGVCHAPVPFWARVTTLAAIGVLLALMRAGAMPTFVPMAIWPILGSMFVFRLVVYMHDLRYQTAPFSLTKSLSYFFLLPNVCFPLFPVVDYQSFCRNYFDEDRFKIYQVGVRWLFRGVVHLIIYRILYREWSISLYDVANAGDLVHYCLWLFLLYLRVSGQFHIIVGMLHLFGFNLAETHHLYYLSSSFTDFWRRINIYWKDFMMKIFFYPVYFRLKTAGPLVALVVSTLVVFALTWALHAVQWFWLRGSFLWAANDLLFWSILAGLVVINSIWEVKRGRRRPVLGQVSWPAALTIGVKTLATFTVICGLWSMWSSESLTAWWTLKSELFVLPTAGGWLLIVAAVTAIVGGAALVARNPNGFAWNQFSFFRETAVRVALMVGLAALSINSVNSRFGRAGELMASAKTEGLNPIEMAELERGYYENLLDISRFNGELWNLYTRRPPAWNEGIAESNITQSTNNFLRYELKPSAHGTFKGQPYEINHWGMHDDECSQKRPAGFFRIALLGDSHAMATGVDRDHDFETLLEERLNRENSGHTYSRYEMLNFAVAGYNPTSQLWVLENKVLAFEPNTVFCMAHPGDEKRAIYHVVRLVQLGVDLHYPFLRDLVQRANAHADTPEPVLRRRLAPFGDELLTWTLHKFAETCKAHNVRPIYLLVPEINVPGEGEPEVRRAEDAGFTVLNLMDVYDGKPRSSLWVAEWDAHPNSVGHQLLAQRLFDLICEKQLLPLRGDAAGKKSVE